MRKAHACGLLPLLSLSLLFVGMLLPVRGLASSKTCNDTAGMPLTDGDATTDLEVTGPCEVKAGTYTYRNVNIYKKPGATTGGSLTFDDAKIDLFAESILMENHGCLIAGIVAPQAILESPVRPTTDAASRRRSGRPTRLRR